jgi:hypothetical protein
MLKCRVKEEISIVGERDIVILALENAQPDHRRRIYWTSIRMGFGS